MKVPKYYNLNYGLWHYNLNYRLWHVAIFKHVKDNASIFHGHALFLLIISISFLHLANSSYVWKWLLRLRFKFVKILSFYSDLLLRYVDANNELCLVEQRVFGSTTVNTSWANVAYAVGKPRPVRRTHLPGTGWANYHVRTHCHMHVTMCVLLKVWHVLPVWIVLSIMISTVLLIRYIQFIIYNDILVITNLYSLNYLFMH